MNKEILLVVEAVSNEKGVEREVIFQAIEAALEMATRKKASDAIDVKVDIDRKTGDYKTFRRWTVIEDADEEEFGDEGQSKLTLTQAKERNPKIKVGESILDPMESVEFGRIAAQKAKQVIIQKVLEAERSQIVNAYKE
ncbi:MAG TPA: NusA N-terminal domain-containing protein, partial [Gammaproteobacteria bacterium]|nr:NusA N-terminal domain-containing protein [Gammaproteobacteria bacterium]